MTTKQGLIRYIIGLVVLMGATEALLRSCEAAPVPAATLCAHYTATGAVIKCPR